MKIQKLSDNKFMAVTGGSSKHTNSIKIKNSTLIHDIIVNKLTIIVVVAHFHPGEKIKVDGKEITLR